VGRIMRRDKIEYYLLEVSYVVKFSLSILDAYMGRMTTKKWSYSFSFY
jgi:hypothetical protein